MYFGGSKNSRTGDATDEENMLLYSDLSKEKILKALAISIAVAEKEEKADIVSALRGM